VPTILPTRAKLISALTYGRFGFPIVGPTRGNRMWIMICVNRRIWQRGMELCALVAALLRSMRRHRARPGHRLHDRVGRVDNGGGAHVTISSSEPTSQVPCTSRCIFASSSLTRASNWARAPLSFTADVSGTRRFLHLMDNPKSRA
jgi:hypothetical protein